MKKIFTLLVILLVFTNGYSQFKECEIFKFDDTQIYYEVYGEGEPLILLHGYTQSSKYWLPSVLDFASDYEVYLIDLPGHGRSGPFKKDFSLKWIAEDVNKLIVHLELSKVKAIGFSYGGDVLYYLASLNPDLIESMITIGSLPNRKATEDFPDLIEVLSVDNRENLTSLSGHQMSEEQIEKMLNEFRKYDSSMTKDELSKINAKVMIVLGDNDPFVPLSKVVKVRAQLQKSNLMILPYSGHGLQGGEHWGFFVKTAKKYFKAN